MTSTNHSPGDSGSGEAREYGIAPPGYRLPDAARPGVVRLQVADLERSLAFYEKVLGLHRISVSGGVSLLGSAGGDNPLLELHEHRHAAPVPRTGRLGLYHFAILLPDRAALGRFVAHLAASGIPAGSAHHLVSEAIYLHDPDGLGIEVYADLPRHTWAHQDRQLAMDSRPLDLEDLARAGGGEEWTGAPAGTVIGHVHLHVGDLEEAARFYHIGLGFDRMVWSYPGALFLAAGGYHHHVGLNTWAVGAAPAAASDARLLEWELVVPSRNEVAAVIDGLRAAGFSAATTSDAAATATDPWGVRVRITAAG